MVRLSRKDSNHNYSNFRRNPSTRPPTHSLPSSNHANTKSTFAPLGKTGYHHLTTLPASTAKQALFKTLFPSHSNVGNPSSPPNLPSSSLNNSYGSPNLSFASR